MYNFPFGQELHRVEQKDRSPKKAFVLGVYASAVHASWIDKFGVQKVSALAVASEPEIFWTGHNAEDIISSISIPRKLGKLIVPKNKALNGPSGRALDTLYLGPLGLSRNDTWLCDLLPESRVNLSQRKALLENYTCEIIREYQLKPATIPDFDISELNSKERRGQIVAELEASQASTIIFLGDLPIRWFLRFFDSRFFNLSQFGTTIDSYGQVHKINIRSIEYGIIPLCHPRQAAKLGKSNGFWSELHNNWIKNNFRLCIKNCIN